MLNDLEDKENSTGFPIENVYRRSSAFMVFSPTKAEPDPRETLKYYVEPPSAKENILLCAKFQNALYLEFGNVAVKSTNFLTFKLQNPNNKKSVHIEISNDQLKNGLSIVFGALGSKEIEIEPSTTAIGTVYWTPTCDTSIREIVKLKMDHKAPLQLTIHGVAGTGKDGSQAPNILGEKKASSKSEKKLNQMRKDTSFSFKGVNSSTVTTSGNRKKSEVRSRSCGSTTRRAHAFPNISHDDTQLRASYDCEMKQQINSENISLISASDDTISSVAEAFAERHQPVPMFMGFNQSTNSKAFNGKRSSKNLSKRPSSGKMSIKSLKSTSDDSALSYDDQWAEKQTKSFTDWLNFTFTQSQLLHSENETEPLSNTHAGNVNNESIASTSNDSVCGTIASTDGCATGLKELMLQRAEARVRYEGLVLYRSDELRNPLRKIEEEVSRQSLSIRVDRDIHADLGMQESLMELFLCYDYTWLRLGLEVIFGKIIMPPLRNSNSQAAAGSASVRCVTGDSRWKNTFKAFLNEHFLTDEYILMRFDKRPLYPAQEKKMKEQLRCHLLKKFLAFVLFLDSARRRQLLPKSTLFSRSGKYKSSKEILTNFCRVFLRGEGDILRHLSLLGYEVHFSQSFIDEFNYQVKNLAVDLRDGVRLVRLYELLTQDKGKLSAQLRVPAVSRLQKVHNVGLVINALYKAANPLKPDVKQIVDGHRDATLMLLWKILYKFELRMLISPQKVFDEIAAIRASDSWRRSVYQDDDEVTNAMAVKVTTDGCKSVTDRDTMSVRSSIGSIGDMEEQQSLGNALLQWCQTIAESYEVPVFNLTSCLADGRALCLLIHYYHPTILPTRLIRKTTAHLYEGTLHDNDLASESGKSFASFISTSNNSFSNADVQKAMHGEKRNFLTLKKACNGIGGIPLILPEFDSKNVPEEKTMIVFLGYLFARLVESSEQVRGAIRIQRWIRQLRALGKIPTHSKAKMIHDNQEAAEQVDNSAIQVSIHVSKSHAAVRIQSWMRGTIQRKRYASIQLEQQKIVAIHNAIIEEGASRRETMESHFSSDSLNEEVESLDNTSYRQLPTESSDVLKRERHSLLLSEMKLVIATRNALKKEELELTKRARQAIEEAQYLAKKEHEELLAKQALAEAERSAREQAEQLAKQECAAREAAEQRLKELELTCFKDRAAVLAAERERLSAQLHFETTQLQLQKDRELHEAAQAQRLAEEELNRIKSEEMIEEERREKERLMEEIALEKSARVAAEAKLMLMENNIRREAEEKKRQEEEALALSLKRKHSATVIINNWRVAIQRIRSNRAEESAVTIQCAWRSSVARIRFKCGLMAVLILQSLWRRKCCVKMMQLRSNAASKVQQLWRCYHAASIARNEQLLRIAASNCIKNSIRSFLFRKQYFKTRHQFIQLQSIVRGRLQSLKYKLLIQATLKIQSFVRMNKARGLIISMHSSMFRLVRMIEQSWLQYKEYKNCKTALCQTKFECAVQAFTKKVVMRRLTIFFRSVVTVCHQTTAAKVISRWFRLTLISRRVKVLIKGFHRLVALRRSIMVRRKFSSAKMLALRRRILESDNRARNEPSLRIGRQTQNALNILQHGKMISQLLKACHTLQLSTSLSRHCCEAFAQADAANILFSLLRSCNRSTAHQELLRVALVVLLNVGRHFHLAETLATAPDSTDALIDLMQMFRDKKSIFKLAAELLTRLISASSATKEQCNSMVYKKRLEGIVHIIERKHRLEMRVRSVDDLNSKNNKSFKHQSPEADDFTQYKGKAYDSLEPINCINHLMKVLEQ